MPACCQSSTSIDTLEPKSTRPQNAKPLPGKFPQEMPLSRNTETYDKWDEAYEDDYFDAPAKSKPKPKKRERTVAGVVVRARGHHYDVSTSDGRTVSCRVRGRLLQERTKDLTLIAVGDRVQVVLEGKRKGLIDSVEERDSTLNRQLPGSNRPAEDVIVANPDQVLIVFAVQDPEPHLRMLDRFLVIAEANELPAIIVANKIDLTGLEAARQKFILYEKLGYPLLYVSATDRFEVVPGLDTSAPAKPTEFEHLRNLLTDKLTVVSGPSGVGKSALINAIHPQLNLRVGDLRNFEGKGRHTTRNAQLFRLPLGDATFIADTPGIRELGLYELDPGSLGFYFVDLKPFVNDCHFPNCTHDHEPECAVRQAAEEGKVSPQRYDSYVRLLNGESFQLEEW